MAVKRFCGDQSESNHLRSTETGRSMDPEAYDFVDSLATTLGPKNTKRLAANLMLHEPFDPQGFEITTIPASLNHLTGLSGHIVAALTDKQYQDAPGAGTPTTDEMTQTHRIEVDGTTVEVSLPQEVDTLCSFKISVSVIDGSQIVPVLTDHEIERSNPFFGLICDKFNVLKSNI